MKKALPIFFVLSLFIGLNATAQYTTTTLIQSMQYPVAFDITPDGRFFCTWKGDNSTPASPGTAVIKAYTSTGTLIGTFYDLSDSVNADFERGLLGITLDPDFSNNGYVYVYYNHIWQGDERIRIVRFTDVNNVGTSPTIIFDLDVSNSIAGNHVGGNLHFRPSDPNHLYFTIGDLAYQQGNPTLNYANKLTNPYGKHLRIGKNGLNIVPTDNPFYDDGNPLATNCDWIWSYGHRNPFDFTFSASNDSLYSSENGWNTWDEMNLVRKGGFYGWANCEGNHVTGSTSVLCSTANAINPLETWGANPSVPAITGILFYSSQVMPEFDNHVLVADNDYGRIYDITLGNGPAWDQFVSRTQWMDVVSESGGLTTIKQGADGCVYAMKGGYTTNGKIYRICPQGLYTEDFTGMISELQVTPNPANENFEVVYSLKQSGRVTISLMDITGRKVAELAQQQQQAGVNRVPFDAASLGLEAGIYFCEVETAGLHSSIKLMITK